MEMGLISRHAATVLAKDNRMEKLISGPIGPPGKKELSSKYSQRI